MHGVCYWNTESFPISPALVTHVLFFLVGDTTTVKIVPSVGKKPCALNRSSQESGMQQIRIHGDQLHCIQLVFPWQICMGNMIWQHFSPQKCSVSGSLVMSLDLNGSGIQDSLCSLLLTPQHCCFFTAEKEALACPGCTWNTAFSLPGNSSWACASEGSRGTWISFSLACLRVWSCAAKPRPGNACLNVLCLPFSSKFWGFFVLFYL